MRKWGLLFESNDLYWFMLIRLLNLPLCRVTSMVSYPRTLGYSPSFEPGVQKGSTLLVAPAEKFRSRITLLQLSTGKVTPYGHVLYQFGETSYSRLSVFCIQFGRNQSGDHLPTSHVGSSRPLKPQLSLGRGPGPMQATAYIGLFANGNDPFPIKIGLQLVWRGVHSGRNHRFGIKDPLFPTEMH